MADPGPTSERLEALRERWRSDPGSRVFLQLADEYRRLDRTEEAARVLEEGLEAHPGHVGAQVALGRCRLELGRPGDAAALLERAVTSDPTQMVAYRLLVDAYLGQGRAEEARQRLGVYTLLNDSDPEIAELRRRIDELERGGAEETAGALAPEAFRPPAPRSEPEPWLEGGLGDEADEGPEPSAGVPAASGSRPRDADGDGGGPDGEPFPALAAPADRRRYLEGLAAGGLFELELEALDPEEEAEPWSPEPATAPEAASWGEVFDLGTPTGAPPPDLSSLLEPSGEAPEPGARPTVTLGRLYLRQGHLREAEEIFHEVLAREPDNAEARRHLEELAPAAAPAVEPAAGPAAESGPPAPASPLGAAELLEDLGGAAGEGLTERKRHVLERYLERLRGRTPRDVH